MEGGLVYRRCSVFMQIFERVPVAQLDRAAASEAVGQKFESSRAQQSFFGMEARNRALKERPGFLRFCASCRCGLWARTRVISLIVDEGWRWVQSAANRSLRLIPYNRE